MSEDTRWSLIEAAAKDRPGAREQFARCYEPVIRSYLGARWRGGALSQEVDDASQEVFATCFADGSPLGRAEPGRGDFRAWLYGVTRNVARSFERRVRARKEVRADSRFEPEADEETLSRLYDRSWAQSLIREAVRLQTARAATSDARQRLEILRLRFEEGLPVRKIAIALGMPVEAAHVAYARGRREFKRALRSVVATAMGVDETHADDECLRLLGFLG